MNNEDKIKRWLRGELSESEKKEFESTEEFTRIDKLMEAVKAFKAPKYNVESEYKKFSENTIHRARSVSLYSRISPLLRIAAIVLLTLAIGYLSHTYINSRSNNQEWITELPEVFLPDSSFVAINSGSKIRFSEKKWKKERNVELAGEAFFKVKEGSGFNVITEQGIVTVLGTEFAVKNWEGYYEVTCYSGLVKVSTQKSDVVLKPDMAYRIIRGTEQQYSVSNKTMPDWINGESSFKSVPLSFVLEELERQYNVKVETRGINTNQVFSGSFSHNNLEVALESITLPFNLYYKIRGNKIVIGIEKT